MDRAAAARLNLPGADEVLVFVAHMPCKLYNSTEDQLHYLSRFADDIRGSEKRRGHQRSIVLGDLNSNPFDAGMVHPTGLNAVSSRDVAAKRVRRVQDDRREYPFFYNPMWRHLGDGAGSPQGTYYLASPKPSRFYWNVLDQVLLRPDLLTMAPNPDVQVICKVGGESLLTPSGRPSSRFSDHLPVLCHLDLSHPSGEV